MKTPALSVAPSSPASRRSGPRRVSPALSRETWEEQSAAGRYNAATVARFKGKRFTLSAGRSDDLTFWSDAKGCRLFCLSLNSGLGYVGLEAFETGPRQSGETGAREACESFFAQSATEELREDIFDLSAATVFRIASEYL